MSQSNYLLTREEEHRLTVRLATLIHNFDHIKFILTQDIVPDNDGDRPLSLNPPFNSLIIENVSAFERWRTIYHAIPKNEITTLLNFLITNKNTQAYDDPLLKEYVNLIDTREINKIDRLVNAVKSGECVVFLGPGFLRDINGETFNKLFAKHVEDKLKAKEIYYDYEQRYNLAYISQRYDEFVRHKLSIDTKSSKPFLFKADDHNDQGWLASKFFHEKNKNNDWHHTDTLYRVLAKFNFRIVINTNPDFESFGNAVEDHNENSFIHAYYSLANGPAVDGNLYPTNHKYKEMTQEERVADWHMASKKSFSSKTLLYNLLGSFENPASVLTAERQLLAFTTRVVKEGPALPRPLTDLFLDPRSYLFLGFDFDQWFIKLIFDTVLKIDRTPDRSISIYPGHNKLALNQANREFFEKVFNMYFVTDELMFFLNKLAKKCGIEI